MEAVILISCLMVYTIVIFIVQCQKHHSYRFTLLCSFFVSILFVCLFFFFFFSFTLDYSLVEICCYLPSICCSSCMCLSVGLWVFVFTFNEHLRISISLRERHLPYRSVCVCGYTYIRRSRCDDGVCG